MKINFKSIMLALAFVSVLSCTPDAIEPMSGIYKAPVDANLTQLDGITIEKFEGYRYINVALSGTDRLNVQFVSGTYDLKPTSYTACTTATAKPGLYNSDNSSFNGEPFTGSVAVTLEGTSTYTISGVAQVGENRYRYSWTGEIEIEPDPEPTVLKQVISAQSNLSNGQKSITMNLGTNGISSSFDMSTFQTVWSGTGFYAAIDLYSEDGYLHEGTYKACAVGGVVGPGEFGIGYDTEYWGTWGTCWWTVDEGSTSAQKILDGEIVVSKAGSFYTIEYNNYDKSGIWFKFEGTIDALTPQGPAPVELSKVISAQSNLDYGTNSLTLKLASDGVSAEPDGRSIKYSGNGNFAAIDLYSADGHLHEGTYKACAEGGVIGENEFGIGYDTEFWGTQYYDWGTCWWTVTDGETSAQKILDGIIMVSKDGENFVIEYSGAEIAFKFTGKIDL